MPIQIINIVNTNNDVQINECLRIVLAKVPGSKNKENKASRRRAYLFIFSTRSLTNL